MASSISRLVLVVYVGTMIAIIVGLDLAFFRQRILERLMLNVGTVLFFSFSQLSTCDFSALRRSHETDRWWPERRPSAFC